VRKSDANASAFTLSVVRLNQSLTTTFVRPASAFRFGATGNEHANSQLNSAFAELKKLNAGAQIRP
jgi:hypothetical protein